MTKNFVRGLGPGGPRVQSLLHKDEERVHTLRFLAGNSGKILATSLDISLK